MGANFSRNSMLRCVLRGVQHILTVARCRRIKEDARHEFAQRLGM